MSQEGKNTIRGTVWTQDNPKNLLCDREQWDDLLGQFRNGEHVRITIESDEDPEE